MRLYFFVLLLSSLCGAQQPGASTSSATPDPLAEAKAHFNAGRFAEAHQAFTAQLPQCAAADLCGRVHAGIIRSLLRQEKVKEADQAAAAAQATWPSDPFVRTAIGEVRFRQGRLFTADKEFVAAANTRPVTDPRAFLGLARYYEVVSMFKRRAEMLEVAHRLDPADPEIRYHWLLIQPLSVRLRELKLLLAGDNNLDKDEREGVHHAIALSEKRAKNPDKRCRLVSQKESAETPMRPLMNGPQRFYGVGLDVKLNDRKAKLLLDTGSSGLLISKRLADKAGLEYLTETKGLGIGDKGQFSVQTANAHSIEIGELRFEDCVVDVIDSSQLGQDGLIGADVFSNYLVTLDFPEQKLRLAPLPKRPEEAKVAASLTSEGVLAGGDNEEDFDRPPVFYDRYIAPGMEREYAGAARFGSHLLLETRLNKNPEPKLFLMDTGATANFISLDAAREVTKVRKDDLTRVVGVSGSVKNVSRADEAVLQFANLQQRVQDLIAFDLTPQSQRFGTEISGILGFSTLRLLKIDIDYRDGLVRFTYQPRPF